MIREIEHPPEIYTVDKKGRAWPTRIVKTTTYRHVKLQDIHIQMPTSSDATAIIVKTSVGGRDLHFVREGVYVSVPAGRRVPCPNFLIQYQQDLPGGYTYYKFNCAVTNDSLVLHYEEDSSKKPARIDGS